MRLTPLNASIATATNAIKKQRQQSETGPTLTRTNENQELLDVPLTTRRDGSPPSFPGGQLWQLGYDLLDRHESLICRVG
jgi:hypothetical protein